MKNCIKKFAINKNITVKIIITFFAKKCQQINTDRQNCNSNSTLRREIYFIWLYNEFYFCARKTLLKISIRGGVRNFRE